MISHLCAATLSTNHHWRRSQFHKNLPDAAKKLFYLFFAFDSLVFAPQSLHQGLHHPCHHYQQIQSSYLQSQSAQSHHQINLCNRRYHWKSANQRDSKDFAIIVIIENRQNPRIQQGDTSCWFTVFSKCNNSFPTTTSPYFGNCVNELAKTTCPFSHMSILTIWVYNKFVSTNH